MANGLTKVEEAALNDAVTISYLRDRVEALEVFAHAVSAATRWGPEEVRRLQAWANELLYQEGQLSGISG